MLEYKSKLNDKMFVEINIIYTSLEHSVCENRDKKIVLKMTDLCVACGFEINPDILLVEQTIFKRAL